MKPPAKPPAKPNPKIVCPDKLRRHLDVTHDVNTRILEGRSHEQLMHLHIGLHDHPHDLRVEEGANA